jgi:2-keto-3-deoxy-L-rhamnonate aldolase RhmA
MNLPHAQTIPNPLLQRFGAGEVALAMMVKQSRTVDIALAARTCGFDAVYLDMQHNNMAPDTAAQIAALALHAGITPLVRIPRNDYNLALRMLDGGALGIIFPDITNADDARAAVDHCKFAPVGHRSTTAIWPHFGYRSVPVGDAQRVLNANTTVIAMIETRAGLANIEAIAGVDGLDVLHVGIGDLASDLGVPGQLHHPVVFEAMERIAAACRAHGRIFGVGGLSGESSAGFATIVGLGAQFVTAANEWSLMISAGTERVRALRDALGKSAG